MSRTRVSHNAGCKPSRFPNAQGTRREALCALIIATIGTSLFPVSDLVAAADVPWLAEVQKPPAEPPRNTSAHLEPLLQDDAGQPIRTLTQWEIRRRQLRDAWMKFLGPMPNERPPVELKILHEETVGNCIRQLVRYESEPGLPVEGYLIRPQPTDGETPTKRAGLVALHATTSETINQIAGVSGRKSRQLGWQLAQQGFVVFCPRNFLWQDVDNYRQAVERFQRRHPHTRGMHKMLYDAQRAIDVLVSLPDVDPKRIGAVGHSLGAKEVLYLAAFDQRIQAAVASEGGLGFRSTNWDAPWYLGPDIHQPDFSLNHHQLLALIAPRPFLVLGGEEGPGAADGDRSWPYFEAALPVYRLHGEPPRIGLFNHRQGHSIPPEAYQRLELWLKTYLAQDAPGVPLEP